MSRTTVTPEFLASLSDASLYAHVEELSTVRAQEAFEQIEGYEKQVVLVESERDRDILSKDYELGSAVVPDDLRVFGSDDQGVLITAEHATLPFNFRELKDGEAPSYRGADQGTGGLAAMMSEFGAQSIVPVGRQTDNVAKAPHSHPLKAKMAEKFRGKAGFLSLHGMIPGKLTALTDTSEIHAVIGLGVAPNETSRELAESLVIRAKDLGLRLTIGNDTEYVIHDPKTNGLKRLEDGELKRGRLMAPRPEMTTNFAYILMEQAGLQVPSMQLEMTRSLRYIASDFSDASSKDRQKRIMGVYLGCLLAQTTVQSILSQQTTR